MAMIPIKENLSPSLEIRINSLNDAKTAVQHSPMIVHEMRKRGLDSLEIVMADEIASQAFAVIGGAFAVKVFYKLLASRPGNQFFALPPYQLILPKTRNGSNGVPKMALPEIGSAAPPFPTPARRGPRRPRKTGVV